MNRLFLIAPAFFFVAALNAQITVTSADMPQAGDTLRKSSSLNFAMYDFSVTGQDFTWDYSGFIPVSQSVDTFVSVSSTPWLYQLVFLGSANLARPLQDFDQIPGFQVTDAFEYYNNVSSGFSMAGYGVTLNGIPFPNKFDTPDYIYRFPLNYGNVDSSFSEYDIAFPGLGYVGGWKKRVNYADGWGTLITPYGSFETVRVKSAIRQYDSVFIDSLGMGFPLFREYNEYKWLGHDFGVPLLEVVDEALNPIVTYIDSVRSLITDVSRQAVNEKGLRVYPNPATETFIVEADFPQNQGFLEIALNDYKGVRRAILYSGPCGTKLLKSFRLNDPALTKGLYFISVRYDRGVLYRKLLVI
ncbi:MAG: T9SS type A sorting domain-containing protein [Bacteroidales bacterium]|nr:T9SS type A sorting domain-containing protein [Bacteroidales bacterium]